MSMLIRSQKLPRQLPAHWIVLCVLFGSSVQYGSYGNEFVIAAPRLLATNSSDPPSISFVMGTWDREGASIFVTTPHYQPDNESLHELIHLEYRAISTFSPASIYHSEVYLGPKWSFRFIGNGTFSLSVSLTQHSKSIASFLAVPVKSWGKRYIAYTLGQYPSLQVVSNTDDNSVLVFFNFNKGLAKVNLTYNNETFSDGRSLHFTLARWQAFVVSNCDSRYSQMLSLTGTVVYGDFPIGVISGNCESRTYTFGCRLGSRDQRAGETLDIAAEMFLPEEAFGREYIVFSLPRRTPGSATIISIEENTAVNISNDRVGGVLQVFMGIPNWRFEVLMTKNRQLVSNKRIQVVIMTLSTCVGRGAARDLGDPSICLLTPNPLFGQQYFWSTPDGITDNYATVIMEPECVKYIHINNDPMTLYNSEQVMGNSRYEVSTFKLLPKHNHIFTKIQIKFACYVYGLGHGVQYMHPAGFDGCQTMDNMFPGDGFDNDCDEEVDEELDDGLDNDGDGSVDEDLRHLEVTDGMWGEWLPWSCNPNCTHPFYYRLRVCNSPPPSGVGHSCVGEPMAMVKDRCKPNVACPRRCPQFTWGEHCNRSCINCGLDCDTETGRCEYCKSGYKRREAGCDRRCEENEYGHDCLLVCSEKCGSDCANRETGECQGFNLYLVVMLVLIVLTFGLLLLWLRKRTLRAGESFVTIKANDSELNASVLSSLTGTDHGQGVTPAAEAVTDFETALI